MAGYLPRGVVWCILAAVCTPAGLFSQSQVFRGAVDVVLIDATVVDNDGTLVRDLRREDFVVKFDGKIRRLVSVQFIRTGESAEMRSSEAPGAPTVPSAAPVVSTTEARLICIAFDRANIRMGEGRGAIQGVETFLARAQPTDRIALVVLPPPGPSVDFTTDHTRIRSALGLVAGSLQPTSTRFNVGLSEAREIARGSDQALNALRARECYGERPGGACHTMVEGEARRMWGDARERAGTSLNALSSLVKMFRPLEGPKTVLLLTEGLAADAFTTELRQLAIEAGRSRVTLYVLHLDAPLFEAASATRRPISATEDAAILNDGVRRLAEATRGAYFRVISSPAHALARVERELAGYYLLGVEPLGRDRDGKPHRIDVLVKGRDLIVRNRREFVMPPQ